MSSLRGWNSVLDPGEDRFQPWPHVAGRGRQNNTGHRQPTPPGHPVRRRAAQSRRGCVRPASSERSNNVAPGSCCRQRQGQLGLSHASALARSRQHGERHDPSQNKTKGTMKWRTAGVGPAGPSFHQPAATPAVRPASCALRHSVVRCLSPDCGKRSARPRCLRRSPGLSASRLPGPGEHERSLAIPGEFPWLDNLEYQPISLLSIIPT